MSIRTFAIAVLAAAVLAFGGGWLVNGWRYDTKLSQLREQQASQAAAQLAAAQQEYARKIREQTKVNENAEKEKQAALADVAAAGVAADRLRSEVALYRERAKRAAAAAHGTDEPRTDTIGLLAQLYDRMEQAGRSVSGYADQLRITGLACEHSYDILPKEQNHASEKVR